MAGARRSGSTAMRQAAETATEDPLALWLKEATQRLDLLKEIWGGLPHDAADTAPQLVAQEQQLRESLKQCPLGDPGDSTTVPRHFCRDPLVSAHGDCTRALIEAELARAAWEVRRADAVGGADPSSLAGVCVNMAMLRMRLFDLDGAILDLERAFSLGTADPRLGLLLRYAAQLRAPREPNMLRGDLAPGSAAEALLKQARLVFLNAGYEGQTVMRATKASSMSEFIFVESRADKLEQGLLESCEEPNPMNPEAKDGMPRIPGELVDLIRIFLLHRVLPLARLCQLFGPECAQLMLTLGMVTAVEGDVCRLVQPAEAAAAVARDPAGCGALFMFSNVAVWPIEEDLLLCTDYEQTFSDEVMEPVMYISEDSHALVSGAPREKVGSILDVCCGSGIQGIVALRYYADKATFVDLNPRALQFTRLNLALNGMLDRCMGCYSGHLEQALPPEVAQQGFDALVGNPPFVPNPQGIASGASAMFGNGGDTGEDVLAAIVRLGSKVVRPGGTVSAVAMTPNVESLPDRIKTWYESAAGPGSSFRALVFRGAPTPADRYQPTSSKAETTQYQAALQSMGVTTLSESVTVIGVGGTGGARAALASQQPPGELWGDGAFLRAVAQTCLASAGGAAAQAPKAPPQPGYAPPQQGFAPQQPPAPASPPPAAAAPPAQAPSPAPAAAPAPAAPARPRRAPVESREGAVPGFQSGFFPGHFTAPGPGWEAKAKLLEAIRENRARSQANA